MVSTTGSVRVKHLDVGHKSAWDAFVHAHREGTFFHLAGWQEIIGNILGHETYYLYVERNGVIEGILPLARIKSRLFGDSLSSLPFCVYGGICASNEEARDALYAHAVELARTVKTGYLEFRNVTRPEAGWQTTDLYVTFRKNLDPDPERNFKCIPRKQRAMVRKGMNNGLKGVIDEDVDRFFGAYSESMRNLGTPVQSRRYYAALKEEFGDRCEILTVLKGERVVCSVMTFYFRDEVLPYYGGGGEAARLLKGNDFMYWDLMRRAAEKGCKIFDYGRSKRDTGSYHFKKNWGFSPSPLHYSRMPIMVDTIPDINPLNPKYRMFIKAWQRMPLQLTRYLGPHIARSLG